MGLGFRSPAMNIGLSFATLFPLWGLLLAIATPLHWTPPHFLVLGVFEISYGLTRAWVAGRDLYRLGHQRAELSFVCHGVWSFRSELVHSSGILCFSRFSCSLFRSWCWFRFSIFHSSVSEILFRREG